MMLHKRVLFCFLMLTANRLAQAQDSLFPGGGFHVGLAQGVLQFKETLINDLRNMGPVTRLSVGFNFKARSFYHDVSLRFQAAGLKDRYGHRSVIIQPELNYLVLKPAKNETWFYGLGAAYSSLLYENENFDGQHNYWITRLSCNLALVWKKHLRERLWCYVPVSLPLFGGLSRPPEDRSFVLNEPDDKASKVINRLNSNYAFFVWGKQLLAVNTGAGIIYRLKNGRQFTAGWNLVFERTNLSGKTILLAQTLDLHFFFRKNT
jgi:hypothetical protein